MLYAALFPWAILSSTCPNGRVFTYGLPGSSWNALEKGCFQNVSHQYASNHSESHHSFNHWLFYAMQHHPCTVRSAENAEWIFVIHDHKSHACKPGNSDLAKMATGSSAWKSANKRGRHVAWLWLDYFGMWKDAMQSFDDTLHDLRYIDVTKDLKPCKIDRTDCFKLAQDYNFQAVTSPYWWNSPVVLPSRKRDIFVSAAWSNKRGLKGGTGIINLRHAASKMLHKYTNSVFIDTTVSTTRSWHFEQVWTVLSDSKFCIVPYGDSPSRRSLSTCIAAGAIPIICSDRYIPPYKQLDWTKFSMRFLEAECASEIEKLIQQNESVEHMQTELQKVQHLFVMPVDGRGSDHIVNALMSAIELKSRERNTY